MTREKAIRNEQRYAEKRLIQLLGQIKKIPQEASSQEIEAKIGELDEQWTKFCEKLIYCKPHLKDLFIKAAIDTLYEWRVVSKAEATLKANDIEL